MAMQINKWQILTALGLGLMLGFSIQEYVASQPSGLIPVVVARYRHLCRHCAAS